MKSILPTTTCKFRLLLFNIIRPLEALGLSDTLTAAVFLLSSFESKESKSFVGL
jgi:hypothetical protein